MARIALVKCSLPPSFNLLVTPPLGIMYLAAVLRREGHQVKLLDLRLQPEKPDWIVNELQTFSPEIIGFSALTQEADSLHRLAARAREIPGVRFAVAGGPHASAYGPQVLTDRNIDFLVMGEGEETFLELVSRLEAGKTKGGIAGVAGRENAGFSPGQPRPYIKDVDSLPLPAWDLINLDQYARAKRMGNLSRRKYASLFTSRGCPYGCGYCHKLLGKEFRPRGLPSIEEEMELLIKKYGVEEFEIVDDIFNLDRARVLDFCNRVLSRGWKIKLAFPNGLRGDLLDFEVLKNLKRAGAFFVALAVETASPRLQEVLGKKLDLERVKKSAEDCRRLGITTLGFFMLGFPGETQEELERTVAFAVDSPFDFATFFVVSPVRGTELARLFPEAPGFYPDHDFQGLDYHRGRFNLSAIPDSEFFRLQRRAYRRFYLPRIPGMIFRGSFRDVSWADGIRHFSRRSLARARGFH